jgi:hypothetical protein
VSATLARNSGPVTVKRHILHRRHHHGRPRGLSAFLRPRFRVRNVKNPHTRFDDHCTTGILNCKPPCWKYSPLRQRGYIPPPMTSTNSFQTAMSPAPG